MSIANSRLALRVGCYRVVSDKRHEFGTPCRETAQLWKPEGLNAQYSETLETNLNH
jgi:hypothetical protein